MGTVSTRPSDWIFFFFKAVALSWLVIKLSSLQNTLSQWNTNLHTERNRYKDKRQECNERKIWLCFWNHVLHNVRNKGRTNASARFESTCWREVNLPWVTMLHLCFSPSKTTASSQLCLVGYMSSRLTQISLLRISPHSGLHSSRHGSVCQKLYNSKEERWNTMRGGGGSMRQGCVKVWRSGKVLFMTHKSHSESVCTCVRTAPVKVSIF